MDASKLTDIQLFKILKNKNHRGKIRDLVKQEFIKRNLSCELINELSIDYQRSFNPAETKPLQISRKIILILFPFILTIHAIIAAWYLRKGEKKKWTETWFYLTLAYGFWIILFFIGIKLFL
jgi:hypothetical protein